VSALNYNRVIFAYDSSLAINKKHTKPDHERGRKSRMLPNIQEKFDSLKLKREALLEHLGSLSTDVTSFKAGSDKWSIVEVVEHLVIVEKDLLRQLSVNVPTSTLDLKAKTPQKHQTVSFWRSTGHLRNPALYRCPLR
jgi:hypothetical protein